MYLRVDDVMTSKVNTIDASLTAGQAAKMMTKIGVSSLVVTSENRITGILTENDLVTQVMARGLSPRSIKVSEIMTQPVIVVKPDSPLDQAVRIMLSQGIANLPVVGGEQGQDLVGALSITEVAMMHPGLYATVTQLEESLRALDETRATLYIS